MLLSWKNTRPDHYTRKPSQSSPRCTSVTSVSAKLSHVTCPYESFVAYEKRRTQVSTQSLSTLFIPNARYNRQIHHHDTILGYSSTRHRATRGGRAQEDTIVGGWMVAKRREISCVEVGIFSSPSPCLSSPPNGRGSHRFPALESTHDVVAWLLLLEGRF